MEQVFELEMQVRDYECDLQGIVNNANYQHYTEHTRHEFLRSRGVSFAELHERGIDAVVAGMQMRFKTPLRSGDEFVSKLGLKKEGIKYVFVQDLYRLPDMRPVFKSTVEAVCLVNGRLSQCPELDLIVPDPHVTTPAKYAPLCPQPPSPHTPTSPPKPMPHSPSAPCGA